MLIIETNYGNFSSTRDIYKFMTLENKKTITLLSASYCCSALSKMPMELTKEQIKKYYV